MAEISEQDLEQLRRRLAPIGRELEAIDHLRLEPPTDLWTAIERSLPKPVVTLTQRRTVPRRGLMALVAAALVVILGVGITVRNDGEGAITVAETALSNKDLDARGAATSGAAAVVRRGDGLALDLRVQRPPQPNGTYLEVWMIDRRVEGMVSLGPYSGDGDYPIPKGIDPGQYPIIDVSLEPIDGVPTHSTVSIVRGVLT